MIVNLKPKRTVNYYLLQDKVEVPMSYMTELTRVNQSINCPAINSLNNRVYAYKPPVTVDIEFGIKNNEPYFNFHYINKDMQISKAVEDLIYENVTLLVEDNKCVFQFLTHLVFVTDAKDNIEVVTYPSGELIKENCEFVIGGFYINSWIRPINLAFIQTDVNKPSYVSLNMSSSVCNITFNQKVKLTNNPLSDKAIHYSKFMDNISAIYKNVIKLSSKIIKNRPKELL